ncbi:MAG: insulinase family protein [Acidobacteria bacterium]|nr:insulinase family protein [Acidobacteriota bacterium]
MPVSVPLAENAILPNAPARNIRTTTLSNGLLVLTEEMPHLRSVSMGVWLRSGSRDEPAELNGISHFVEHMVFKGTTTRTQQQFASEVDAIGGNLDAFTGKETVCFNVKVLDTNIHKALELLSDLVLNPVFDAQEVEREQGVILEEIKMDEDNPDYLVHETFMQNFWPDDSLGRPILGTGQTVSSFTQKAVKAFHKERFSPLNMVFSAAGNFSHDHLLEKIQERFGSLAPGAGEDLLHRHAPPTTPHITLRNKPSLEQVQICLAVPAPPVNSPDRYPLYLMSNILGGGMSSRLFQSVREEAGLAYSIFSEMNPFRDTGSLAIYAGTSIEKLPEMIRRILAEIRLIKNVVVNDDELSRAKEQLKGNIVLGLESSSSRMSNLARQQINFGRFATIDEITTQIDGVAAADLQRIANDLFQQEKIALTLLGNLGKFKITRDDLAC